jgi:hypothetical protein
MHKKSKTHFIGGDGYEQAMEALKERGELEDLVKPLDLKHLSFNKKSKGKLTSTNTNRSSQRNMKGLIGSKTSRTPGAYSTTKRIKLPFRKAISPKVTTNSFVNSKYNSKNLRSAKNLRNKYMKSDGYNF